jgi:hypothetical protein
MDTWAEETIDDLTIANHKLIAENARLQDELTTAKAQYLADFGAKLHAELMLRTAVGGIARALNVTDPDESSYHYLTRTLSELKEIDDDFRVGSQDL